MKRLVAILRWWFKEAGVSPYMPEASTAPYVYDNTQPINYWEAC